MKLNCPNCGRSIPAEDVNIALAIAKCSGCDQVFNFAKEVGLPALRPDSKTPVPMPPKFTVEELGSELVIRWSWYSHAVWFLLFFCIFWDGFLIFWYSMAFFGASQGMGAVAILFLLFPLLHVAVGVGLTYFVFCSFINSTVIRISQGELTVRHGPLPWFGNHTLATFEISQLYCSEKVSNNRRGYHVHYDLNVMRSDNTKLSLLTLEELDQVLYLEQKLESCLKIEDQRVPGEVRS
jgi:hypothetical protein